MFHEFGLAERLQKLLTRWSGAMRLGEAAFAGRFFDRSPDDRAVPALHAAVAGVSRAQSQDDLRGASKQVATAMQAIGLAVGAASWPTRRIGRTTRPRWLRSRPARPVLPP